MQGLWTCPADIAACASFSLVVFPGRSSSWMAPRRSILSSEDTLPCLWLLTFHPLYPLWREKQFLGFLGRWQIVLAQKCPELSYLSRDFKVELIITLRSIFEWLLLSKGLLRRGEREVVGIVVGKIWDHSGLLGECKGRSGVGWQWVVVKEDGEHRWEAGVVGEDERSEKLGTANEWTFQPFEWPIASLGVCCPSCRDSFFTADGSIWCSGAALHTDFLFFSYDALVL